MQLMKRILKYLLVFVAAVAVTACADDSGEASYKSESAFRALFPNCSADKWSTEPGYEIAYFSFYGNPSEAWFDHNGWVMTYRRSCCEKLPQKAQDELSDSYSLWETVGVHRADRKGLAAVYVVTVERNKVVYDLYFAEDGTLVRKSDVTNSKSGTAKYLPAPANAGVSSAMSEKYPDAVVYNAVVKDGAYLIAFVTGGAAKTAVFANDGGWLFTTTPLNGALVSKDIVKTVGEQLPGAKILACTLTETQSSTFYTVECDYEGTLHTLYLDK